MNGPNRGHDVFIPMDWVIGGQERVGTGVAHADGMPRRRALDFAAGAEHRRGQAGRACHRRLCRRHASSSRCPSATFEGVSGSAGAHRRQRLPDGCGAHADRGGARHRRKALGGLGDRQVSPDRTHAPGRQRRHGRARRQRHLHGSAQFPGQRPTRPCRSASPSKAPTFLPAA